ncbi:WD40 domain-containing protein [Spironucleus salmonicida]|uniref:WD40 domain-containing protein n=1 Tax=Spironucleus salmonicida TaxID=348837 RepID=V6LQ15_9EUKA|nr:WD40 domain-containing protein [Spironucleus salmonicida]|eukprot:EST45806.1 WD40 domain-containing protein [Spironucleus salmonicida]
MSFFTSLKTRVYDLTPKHITQPQFLTKVDKKASTSDKSFHLIPNLGFPQITYFTKRSPDANFLLAAGTYPQQIRLFDLNSGAMKLQRNVNSDVVGADFLGMDWRKIALICANRELIVQGQGGTVFNKRVPKLPRACQFVDWEGILQICGTGNELFQLDLISGKFRESLVGDGSEYSALCCEKAVEVIYACGDSGITAFDCRVGKIGSLLQEKCSSVCSNAMKLCVGSQSGFIYEYDIRSNVPMRKIKHGNSAINKLSFYENFGEKGIVGSDSRQMRIYQPDGQLKCYVEPNSAIQSFESFDKSGLFLLSCETQLVQNYYIPDLGPAPLWAKDLDQQIQQIDIQQQTSQFANHRFVTEADLKALNLLSLTTTDSVIPQMHGYYVPKDILDKAVNSTKQNVTLDIHKIEQQKKIDLFRTQRDKIQLNEDNKKQKEQELSDDRFDELFNELGGIQVTKKISKPVKQFKTNSKRNNTK